MDINKKILAYFEANGISQTDLAKKIGMSKQNLFRILNTDDIKVSQLVEITRALGLPATYFFDGKEHISNEEIEGYKKRISELEYLVNLNKRAEIEKYIQTIKELLKYEFPNETPERKQAFLSGFIESINNIDDIFNKLAKELSLEVSDYSREALKAQIQQAFDQQKREEKLLPRAKNIHNIRQQKKA